MESVSNPHWAIGLYTDNLWGRVGNFSWTPGREWMEADTRAAAIEYLVFRVGEDWECAKESHWQRPIM